MILRSKLQKTFCEKHCRRRIRKTWETMFVQSSMRSSDPPTQRWIRILEFLGIALQLHVVVIQNGLNLKIPLPPLGASGDYWNTHWHKL